MEKRCLNVEFCEKDKVWATGIWKKLDQKLYRVSQQLPQDVIPYTTKNGIYTAEKPINMWTNGFWPGLMWLMYVGTGKEQYLKAAEHTEELLDEALSKPWCLHHDVGFMWNLSSGVNYRLFGGDNSKARLLHAADHLASRYNSRGRYISSTNQVEGRTIIDTMMNLPLLYLASEITQQKRYRYVAENHADHIMETHLREDGSVRHVVDLNPTTGEVVGYSNGQGYSEDSAWARGQTWAIYGYTLSYIYTGKREYLEAAKRVAHFFIANIADCYIPRVDLKAPGKEHDTTAGTIAVSGLIELANCVNEFEKPMYLNAAIKILKAIEETYCDWSMEDQAILQHGVEKYFPEEKRQGQSIIYGDYFFVEAIYKMKGFQMLFW